MYSIEITSDPIEESPVATRNLICILQTNGVHIIKSGQLCCLLLACVRYAVPFICLPSILTA